MKPFNQFMSAAVLALTMQLAIIQSAVAGYEPCTEEVYKCSTTYDRQCGYENVCHTIPGERQCRTSAPRQECHTVPGHQECHIVPGDRQCHQERVCSANPPSCHTVQECGTNALGNPICKDRMVCEDRGEDCNYQEVCSGSDSRQECSDTGSTQECGLVPGEEECYDTGSRQECSNEYRCSDQPRQTCGYETVHKTCYVPDPYEPPHNPPSEPPYVPPSQPPYEPPTEPNEPPYHPPVTPPSHPPTHPPITPPVVPQPPIVVPPTEPSPADPVYGNIGAESIKDFTLDISKKKSLVSISLVDKGQNAGYTTRYFIAVNDSKGQRVISQFATGSGSIKKQTIKLQKELALKQSYTVEFKVVRTGGQLTRDVSFLVSKKVAKQ